ncbi:hypothetical protein DOQ87_25620, partial [Salmonella enterica subsp. enterica serovar Benin]|nr:hypothetical protein [Salmonella enterica subsp. enterica serovar Benin]
PVTNLQPLIESFTHSNAIVLDPFAGSGSNCVTAVRAGRSYIGIELHKAGITRLSAVQRAMQCPAANDIFYTVLPGVADYVITEVFIQYSNQQYMRVINVEESDRLSFLPYLFDDDFMIAKMQVYALARKMIAGYEDEFWHFIRLPDGGGYMMPDCGPVHLINSENWFIRTVSADAAGIILTSLAINRRLWTHHACGNAALTHMYMLHDTRIWNHITFHPEWNAIYAAPD